MKKSQLSEHQQEVFQQITDKIKENLLSKIVNIPLFARFLSLTGAAGTGKSYLTAAIVDEIDNFLPVGQYDIYVTAPTHKAVTVMKEMLFYSYDIGVKCCTIHSFLSLKQSYNYETGAEKFTIDRSKDKINRASLLIVDESSMVSNELFEFIAEVVKKGYVNTVLFIGDSYQLLPVNQSSLNDVFRLRNQFKLTQIVRQSKDSQIIQLSTEIRTKISTNDYVDLREIFDEIDKNSEDIQFFTNKREFIKDFYKNENWQDEDKILTSFTNNEVDNFNNAIRRRFWREQGNDAPKFLLSNDKIRFKKPSFDINSDNQKILFQNGEEVTIEKAELIFDEKLRFYYWDCLATGRPLSSFRVVDPYSIEKFNDILNDYAYFARTSNYPERMKIKYR
jgi:ATP-dependent exoDNAse (exonuclease V) alpha subunit